MDIKNSRACETRMGHGSYIFVLVRFKFVGAFPSSIFIVYCTGAAISAVATATVKEPACEERFTADSTLTFERVWLEIMARKSRTAEISFLPIERGTRVLSSFWSNTWPFLRELARENEATVVELIDEYFILTDLIKREAQRMAPQLIARDQAYFQRVLDTIDDWEQREPAGKLKAKHWDRVALVYGGLHSLALLAFSLEVTWRNRPSFHPLARLDGPQIRRIFDSLEQSSLERAVALVDILRPKPNPPLAANSRAAASLNDSMAAVPSEPHTPELPEIVPTRDLRVVLREGLPLAADWPYEVTTLHGDELEVSFAPRIVKAYDGSRRPAIQKLLRTLLTGRRHRAGIKTLFDIGPGVVEIKAVLDSHTRLIGCLKGRSLRLKWLLTLKASRATYSRRIPPGLCSE